MSQRSLPSRYRQVEGWEAVPNWGLLNDQAKPPPLIPDRKLMLCAPQVFRSLVEKATTSLREMEQSDAIGQWRRNDGRRRSSSIRWIDGRRGWKKWVSSRPTASASVTEEMRGRPWRRPWWDLLADKSNSFQSLGWRLLFSSSASKNPI